MKNPDIINRKDISNLCKLAIESGGSLTPIKIPAKESLGDGLTNGSILRHENKWLLNLRRVGYLLYQSENKQELPSPWGPLVYLNPENDVVLRTENYMCELKENTYEVKEWSKTNTSKLDVRPRWEFIGLEDARLQFWNNKLYQTGVRRDTTTNGEGRMELSTVEKSGRFNWAETERVRIAPPDPRTHAEGGSYCEKNWMSINDMPNHYIKWASPTELVKVDPTKGTSEIVKIIEQPHISTKRDMRGSSNVIKYKDYWVAIIHEVDLWFNKEGQKDSIYYHRFIVWDKDWKIQYMSDEFDFMTGRIEFTCGIALDKDNFIIPFGFQDHTSFMLKLPVSVFENITGMNSVVNKSNKPKVKSKYKKLYSFIDEPFNSINAFNLAEEYYKEGHWSSALGFYLRSAEFTDNPALKYDSFYMVCKSLANKDGRPNCEEKMWKRLIDLDPHRPEGYAGLIGYYSWRGKFHEAYFWSKLGMSVSTCKPTRIGSYISLVGTWDDFNFYSQLYGGTYGKIDDKLNLLKSFVNGSLKYPKNMHEFLTQEAIKYKLIK